MKLSNNKKRKIKEMVDQASEACAHGRFDACEQICGRIESLQPGNPDVANIRAIMCAQTGQLDRAEQFFMDAAERAPRRSQFHGNLGKLYLEQGRFTEALPRLRQAIDLDPNDLPMQLSYCKALLETEGEEEAYAMLQQAKKRSPHDPVILMGLYFACRQLDREDEGRAYLQEILERDPDHPEARFELDVLDDQGEDG